MENESENLIWVIIGIVFVVAAVAILIFVLSGGTSYNGYNGYNGGFGMMGGYGYYGAGIFMPVVWVISAILVVLLLYFIFVTLFSPHRDHYTIYREDAERTAKERFARGEINEDEYHRIMNNIRK